MASCYDSNSIYRECFIFSTAYVSLWAQAQSHQGIGRDKEKGSRLRRAISETDGRYLEPRIFAPDANSAQQIQPNFSLPRNSAELRVPPLLRREARIPVELDKPSESLLEAANRQQNPLIFLASMRAQQPTRHSPVNRELLLYLPDFKRLAGRTLNLILRP
jgi:hypothetical protein